MTLYPWQQPQWDALFAARQQNYLSHALLLIGPQGFGKIDFARVLAKAVLCDHTGEFACGACRSCHLFSSGTHPDFLTVGPEEKSKAIKVDQIRELNVALSQTAQRGGYQVVIVSPAHSMNRAAANAFLKTLEEPTGRVLIILVSHQCGALPATITSRCQKITFSCANRSAVLAWLQTQLPSDADASLLLKLAHDAPLFVLKLLEVKYLLLRDELLKHLWRVRLKKTNPIAPVKALLQQDLSLLLRAFASLTMDILRLQLSVDDHYVVNEDRVKALRQLADSMDREKVLVLLAHVQEAQKLLNSSTSVNVQMMLESLLLEWGSSC